MRENQTDRGDVPLPLCIAGRAGYMDTGSGEWDFEEGSQLGLGYYVSTSMTPALLPPGQPALQVKPFPPSSPSSNKREEREKASRPLVRPFSKTPISTGHLEAPIPTQSIWSGRLCRPYLP